MRRPWDIYVAATDMMASDLLRRLRASPAESEEVLRTLRGGLNKDSFAGLVKEAWLNTGADDATLFVVQDPV